MWPKLYAVETKRKKKKKKKKEKKKIRFVPQISVYFIVAR
jgi:hypothetical protein